MENRIVLELIQKDLEELRILVEALKLETLPDQILVDITTAKAKTLYHEFSLLKGIKKDQSSDKKDIESEEVNLLGNEPELFINAEFNDIDQLEKEQVHPQEYPFTKVENIIAQAEVKAAEIPVVETNAVISVSVKTEVPEEKIIITTEPISPMAIIHAEPQQEVVQPIEPVIEISPEKPEVVIPENESESKSTDKKVLGESFTKEPSLNDRLSTGNTHESKIKGKPITNLKKAIGLNDKFMFTRELFENDHNKFELSIDKIDQCANLLEAIEYMEQNFKWAKNTTSLKFIEMVKMRFEK